MKRNEIIRNVGVCENGVLSEMKMSEDYRKIHSRVGKAYDALKDAISKYPEIEKLFDKFEKEHIDLYVEECDFNYSEGFRLGFAVQGSNPARFWRRFAW